MYTLPPKWLKLRKNQINSLLNLVTHEIAFLYNDDLINIFSLIWLCSHAKKKKKRRMNKYHKFNYLVTCICIYTYS